MTKMDKVTKIMVKSKNLPMRGTTNEVGGMMSARRRTKTTRERRMEMLRAIFSPLSEGRWKTRTVIKERTAQGRMRLTVWNKVLRFMVRWKVIWGRKKSWCFNEAERGRVGGERGRGAGGGEEEGGGGGKEGVEGRGRGREEGKRERGKKGGEDKKRESKGGKEEEKWKG